MIHEIWDWIWGLDKAPFAVALTVVSYFTLQQRIKLFTQEHEIRKKYNSKVFAKIEEVLKSVVHRNYEYMYTALADVVKECPAGMVDCHSAQTSIESQLHTYHLILRDVFMYTIKNSIKILIFDNGYHTMSVEELNAYFREHSMNLFTEALAEIKMQCGNKLPEIVDNFGHAYVPEDAYKDFKKIIEYCIGQHSIRDHKIKELHNGWKSTLSLIKKGIGYE